MIKLHVVQAEYGDCFILESNQGKNKVTVLIDGGPHQTFKEHLKPTLQKLPLSGKLDLMVLSHIDNDHIIGLIDLLNEIKTHRDNGMKELIKINKIWHNSYKELFQLRVEPNKLLRNIFPIQGLKSGKNVVESIVMKGFQQGGDLTILAKSLKIPINPSIGKAIVVYDNIKSIYLYNIGLHLLGPTRKNLDKLRKEWNDWFDKKKRANKLESSLLQILDKSIPNLASIMFIAQIKNKKILFTGDGIGQDIIEILSKNKMLDKNGKFHVDILKVPHHGSDRNTSQEFFDTIHADYYIISANGRDDNPSLNTLKWMVESGKIYNKPRKIVFTNMTPNIKKVLDEYDKEKFNYESIFLEKEDNFLTIVL